jgi:uncharacterized RDD family membrane protein YckC
MYMLTTAFLLRRTIAFLVDIAILSALFFLICFLLLLGSNYTYSRTTDIVFWLILVVYFGLKLQRSSYHRTAGLTIMDLKLASIDGTPPSRSSILLRTIVFWLPIILVDLAGPFVISKTMGTTLFATVAYPFMLMLPFAFIGSTIVIDGIKGAGLHDRIARTKMLWSLLDDEKQVRLENVERLNLRALSKYVVPCFIVILLVISTILLTIHATGMTEVWETIWGSETKKGQLESLYVIPKDILEELESVAYITGPIIVMNTTYDPDKKTIQGRLHIRVYTPGLFSLRTSEGIAEVLLKHFHSTGHNADLLIHCERVVQFGPFRMDLRKKYLLHYIDKDQTYFVTEPSNNEFIDFLMGIGRGASQKEPSRMD